MTLAYDGHSFIIRLIAAEGPHENKVYMGFLKPLFAIFRRRVFSAGMRRIMLRQRAIYIRENRGTRRMRTVGAAQRKAAPHFYQV